MRLDSPGIVAQVEQRALRNPQSVAAWHREKILSYQELSERSAGLAQELREHGVVPGSIVGVCVRPCFDILTSIVAIFRCGAVYMPLDPDHPEAHIKRILDEARPQVVLTHRVHELSALPVTASYIFLDEKSLSSAKSESIQTLAGEQPAYLMYTSGTTGQPKGVLIANDNLHHYLSSAQSAFQFKAQDIFCNVARYTFSISLFDLLLPLSVGASVRLLDRQDVFDFTRLTQHLAQSTVFHAGPSLLATLFRYRRGLAEADGALKGLRHVSTGGDLVLPVIMEGMKEHFPAAELYVMYGTTEISCMGTFYPIPRSQKMEVPSVGKPFPGVEVFIRDEEICFAGAGVGLGYLSNPELTQEKFPSWNGRRIYHTGDFGRLLPDGNVEMIGRRDFQVQLRGIRLELSAIENSILKLGLATQCAVIHRRNGRMRVEEDSGFLVAFLVGATQRDAASLTKTLASYLPAEMIPARFVHLEAMPVTFNGKLDRRKLMEFPLDRDEAGQVDEEATPLERSIAEIISSSLGVSTIGLRQDFFELGGHSLLAILILSELNQKLGLRIMPHVFFQNPTVKGIAEFWQAQGASNAAATSCNLIPLNAQTAKSTIYFLAGAHIYRPLAQALEGKWSAFSIISEKELGSDWAPRSSGQVTMEELAHDSMQAILKHQSQGPYTILGYSFAGILAFEVAQQMRAAGHEVAQLILLDPVLPEWVFRWRFRINQLKRVFRTRPSELLTYLVRKTQEKNMTDQDKRYGIIEEERENRNRLLAEDYCRRMKSYSGSALLFVAGERLKRKPLLSRSCGWKPLIKDLRVVRIDADHFKMVEDSQSVQQMARELTESRSPTLP